MLTYRNVPRSKVSLLINLLLWVVSFLLVGCGGGGTTSGSGGSPPPPPPPPPGNSTLVSASAKQLAYDSTRQRLYVSIWHDDSSHPNTVAVIDPSTGSIETTISVDADPNRLAISRDGQYLFVGTDSNGSVTAIDLPTRTVAYKFSLGTDPLYGTMVAGDIQAMPGSPDTVAIARKFPNVSPPHAGVAIFDHGIQRPTTTPYLSSGVDLIAFSDDPSVLYGMDNTISDFAFVRMKVTTAGISVLDTSNNLLGFGYYHLMAYDAGRVFATNGAVADPANLSLVGQFPLEQLANSVVPDAASDNVYFLLPASGVTGARLVAYDRNTLLKVASLDVTTPSSSETYDLVKCGDQGFAFLSFSLGGSSNAIVITKNTLTPVSSTLPTLDRLVARHLLYDPTRQRVYASVPSSVGTGGNSVAVIDPTTKTIEKFISVGSDPDVLALSDDDQYLYVSLESAGAIRRVALATETADFQFSLGSDSIWGPRYAADISVMPGHPDTIAVAMKYLSTPSPNIAGVAIYDHGVRRPNTLAMTAFLGESDGIAFSDSPSLLYGYGNQVSGQLNWMTVDANGVTLAKSGDGLVSSRDPRLAYSNGRIYSRSGNVVDPSIPGPEGQFDIGTNRGFTLDSSNAYFLSDSASGHAAIYAFDRAKYTFSGYLELSVASGQGHELVQCGANGFAVATDSAVVFASSQLTPPPDLATSARNLPVNHLVYDPGRHLVYASVAGFLGPKGNAIAVIDPDTTNIVSLFYVGSDPNAMAISRDGSTLYVGLDGSAEVASVDLLSKAVSYTFRLPSSSTFTPRYAGYISVRPDDPNIVAVSRSNAPYGGGGVGVALYDHGTQLADVTDSPFESINAIAFADSPTELYGYNNTSTGFEFYRLNVGDNGVTIRDKTGRLINNFFVDISADSGLIYSSNGTVVDPTQPAVAGTYANANHATTVALDDTGGQAFFLSAYDPTKSPPVSILRYDKSNFTFLGTTPVAGVNAQGYDLIHHGTSRLIFATVDGHVVFTDIPSSPPVDVALSSLPANRMVYDSLRQRIYASVPSRAGGVRGNTVTIINPATSSIDASIPVGSEPDALTISADGQYLYVGLDGAGFVRRINLTTRQVDLSFALGADSFFGPMFAESLAVSPSNSNIVVVSREYSGIAPHHAGVAIFNNGVQLSNTTPRFDGSNVIAFASSSNLYGYCNEQTSYGFFRMQVNNNGVTVLDETPGLINGHARIAYDSGLVYSTTGNVLDPAAKNVVGTFSVASGADAVVPDSSTNKVFFLIYDSVSKKVTITGFDKNSHQQTGSLNVAAATSEGTDLVRWGTNGFAVSTGNQIILLSGSLP